MRLKFTYIKEYHWIQGNYGWYLVDIDHDSLDNCDWLAIIEQRDKIFRWTLKPNEHTNYVYETGKENSLKKAKLVVENILQVNNL